jgi:sulfoxide reductase heme-binding subunit YedZ
MNTAVRAKDTKATMLRSNYWVNRASRHFILASGAAGITLFAYLATPPPDVRHRLSMGTAYAGLAFLTASLWLGPWNVLRGKPNPVSFDLRRDIGIWTGILAIVHTMIGLTVHLRGRMWMYFFKSLHPPTLQNTQFGFANYVGLGAALLFLVLLAISNDFSLRSLGTRRWKSLQRWAYIAFGLTVAHGIAYQLVEKRRLPWVVLFACLVITVTTIQSYVFIRNRLRRRIDSLCDSPRRRGFPT